MKIDVVASPRKNAIEPRAAAAVEEICRRFPALHCENGEQRFALPISDGEAGDWQALSSEFASAVASSDKRNFDLTANVTQIGERGSAAKTAGSEAVVGWTPESGKLRDLNGSAANAALPKVLAGLAATAARAGSPLETEKPGGQKSFRPRSVVVANASSATAQSVVAIIANRYAALNPRQGAVVAVVESLRELACRGAAPLGLMESARIGTPLTAASFRDVIETFRGLSEAWSALKVTPLSTSFAAVSDGEAETLVSAVGGSDHGRSVASCVTTPGDRFIFLGDAPSEIGASQYLRSVHNLVAGEVPVVDFAAEQRLHDVLTTLIKAGIATSVRDISAGGLMSAVCAMLLGGEKTFGAVLDLTTLGGSRADALLFGESQSRAVITVSPERVGTVLSEAHMRGVSAALIGEVTDGSALVLKTRSLETEWPLATLVAAAS